MVRVPFIRREIDIIDNVDVEISNDKVVIVKGPKGEIKKDFSHVKDLLFYKEDNKIVVEGYFVNKKAYAMVRTILSKIKNMMLGVTKGFRYKMKIVYAHYPMSVEVDKKRSLVIIKNFLGEKDVRIAKIMPGVDVKVTKDDVIVEGIDIDAVGQTVANIHLATHLSGKKRMSPHGREGGPGILDGIYVYEKGLIE